MKTIIENCVMLKSNFVEDPDLIEKALFDEIGSKLVCQMDHSKGWPFFRSQNHKMARFGDDDVTYTYGDKSKKVLPWTTTLSQLKNLLHYELNEVFNCVVVNSYTPEGSLYPHRDSKYIHELGKKPIIACISFGATRKFNLYPVTNDKIDKTNFISIPLNKGDLLLMYGDCDEKYFHGILPEPDTIGIRLSLTFRQHKKIY